MLVSTTITIVTIRIVVAILGTEIETGNGENPCQYHNDEFDIHSRTVQLVGNPENLNLLIGS